MLEPSAPYVPCHRLWDARPASHTAQLVLPGAEHPQPRSCPSGAFYPEIPTAIPTALPVNAQDCSEARVGICACGKPAVHRLCPNPAATGNNSGYPNKTWEEMPVEHLKLRSTNPEGSCGCSTGHKVGFLQSRHRELQHRHLGNLGVRLQIPFSLLVRPVK